MLKNFTPHVVTIVDNEGSFVVKIEPEAIPARCAVSSQQVSTIEVAGVEVPVSTSIMGAAQGLPAPEAGVYLVVSRIVAEACKGTRSDLVVPDKTVRNAAGQIIGCAGFAVV